MITPTKKLLEFVGLYKNRAHLCERLEMDQTTMSRILKGKRGASSRTMEKFCRFVNWPLSEAWEMSDAEEKVS